MNYFFMFDLNKAFGYFPFLTRSGEVCWSFGRFEVYPIVIAIIYIAFTIFYLLVYYLVKQWYKFEEDRLNLRESRIDLFEKITKKKIDAPRRYTD